MTVTHELPPPATLHVGLDVAKLTLQADLAGRDLALPNTPAGHRSLLAHLRRLHAKTGRPTHVVCEGTGGYERAVVRALASGQPTRQRPQRRPRARLRSCERSSGQDRRARCGGPQRLRRRHATRRRHPAQRERSGFDGPRRPARPAQRSLSPWKSVGRSTTSTPP